MRTLSASPPARALHWWCNKVVAGALGSHVLDRWRDVLCVPLVKEDNGVRPLLIGEVWMKLPAAGLHAVYGKKCVAMLVEQGQFGVGQVSAVE
eukprot:15445468-Alexandrium_andersonii.AAC.1